MRVVAITDKAVLCDFSQCGETKLDGELWIPFSQISVEDSEIDETSEIGDEGALVIPAWLAAEKGLE